MKKNFELAACSAKITRSCLLPAILAVFFTNALSCFAQSQTPSGGKSSSSPIQTPTNTVGNTPSAVRRGARLSGSSAGGNPANLDPQTGQHPAGQPISSGKINPSGK